MMAVPYRFPVSLDRDGKTCIVFLAPVAGAGWTNGFMTSGVFVPETNVVLCERGSNISQASPPVEKKIVGKVPTRIAGRN